MAEKCPKKVWENREGGEKVAVEGTRTDKKGKKRQTLCTIEGRRTHSSRQASSKEENQVLNRLNDPGEWRGLGGKRDKKKETRERDGTSVRGERDTFAFRRGSPWSRRSGGHLPMFLTPEGGRGKCSAQGVSGAKSLRREGESSRIQTKQWDQTPKL